MKSRRYEGGASPPIIWLLFGAVILATSCTRSAGSFLGGEALRPSAVVGSELVEARETVVVEGVVRVGVEYAGIWDSHRDIDEARFRTHCLTLWDPDSKIPVPMLGRALVSGKVVDAGYRRLVVLGGCGKTTLRVERINLLP